MKVFSPKIVFSALISVIAPATGSIIVYTYLFDRYWIGESFHSVIEAIGAFAAITLAIIFLLRPQEKGSSHRLWISYALIGMGLLDLLHASVQVSQTFVWLHSAATLVGGFIFALVWIPTRLVSPARHYGLIVAVVIVVFSGISMHYQNALPLMVEQGMFTSTAKTINFFGGFFFFLASIYFVIRFQRFKSVEDILFVNLCLLFGTAGFLFHFSWVWNANWWFWHILRLTAYLLILVYLFVSYQRVEEKVNQGYYIQSVISSVLQISLEPISLERQLERVLDLILSIPWISLESKGCIFLVNNDSQVLEMKAQRHLSESLLTICKEIPFGRCLCGQAATSREIVFSHCIDDRHKTIYENMLPHGHYCVPIASGNHLFGVINLYVKEGHKREPKEEEFLSAVANTLAGIIERKGSEQEKERLKDQLIHYEKLSALGRLTANVAHGIRNPLTSLGGFARRLNKKVADSTKEKEYCKVIISEVMRLEKLLKNVLVFSKDLKLQIGKHNINEVVAESLKSFQTIRDERSIALQASFGDIPGIRIDREQVKQAIDNLISNAIESMPNGGTLGVETYKEFLNGIIYVVVRLTDEGDGIPEEKLSIIFEPFFTTKAVGLLNGTGLGLSITRKIMEEHCGLIKAESLIGKGSIFSLFFPYQSEEEFSKIQCWQYSKCGRDSNDGIRCPAYPNFGRSCWAVAGTYCGGKVQGSHAEKIESCRKCPFYQEVIKNAKK